MKKYKLIKEYPGSPKLGTNVIERDKSYSYSYQEELFNSKVYLREKIEDYPEFWEEIVEKQYQILEFRSKLSGKIAKITEKGIYEVTINFLWATEATLLADKNTEIYKVKRLSDGEIFTIGDKTTEGIIEEITLSDYNPGIFLNTNSYHGLPLVKWKKQPLSLFKTEDNVEMFKGDKYWFLTHNFNIVPQKASLEKLKPGTKRFSNIQAAEEYVDLHRPQYSLKDINEASVNVLWKGDLYNFVKKLQYNKKNLI